MAMDQTHRRLTAEAIDEAYKARVRLLYDAFDDALLLAEDEQDIDVAEGRLRTGLEKALMASARTRAVAGLDDET